MWIGTKRHAAAHSRPLGAIYWAAVLLAVAQPIVALPFPSLDLSLLPLGCKTASDCSGHGTCVSGRCECELGWTGHDCRQDSCPMGVPPKLRAPDPASGATGSGGSCSGRGLCLVGRCVCVEGFTGDDCSLVSGLPAASSAARSRDVRPAAGHSYCSGHGALIPRFGRCLCDHGWAGEQCESDTCVVHGCSSHGTCEQGMCRCDAGFTGPGCERRRCPGDKAECSLRGTCDALVGECHCQYGWSGPDCNTPSCPSGCSGHGYCLGRSCECVPGWEGDACERRSDGAARRGAVHAASQEAARLEAISMSAHTECERGCSGHGRCVRGSGGGWFARGEMPKCVCERGWSGISCATPTCDGGCSNRGYCVAGRCQCPRCWAGPQCVVGTADASCERATTRRHPLLLRRLTRHPLRRHRLRHRSHRHHHHRRHRRRLAADGLLNVA